MPASLPFSTQTIVILACIYLALALHTAISMGRYGRRWWLWFILSVLFTPLPAAVVSCVDYVRKLLERQRSLYQVEPPEDQLPDAVRRCPHCRTVLAGAKPRAVAGKSVCPKCGMALDSDELA